MTRLHTLDLPSLHRASIGFDRLFNELDRSFTNSQSQGYPPYNILQINEDEFMISLAVAGFTMDNLDITKDRNVLTIEGAMPKVSDEKTPNYIHKGIAERNFRREFRLAEHVDIVGASLELGMLNVHLHRDVPAELQPRKIAITGPANK